MLDEILSKTAFYASAIAFLAGLLLAAFTGSARVVKIFIAVVSAIFAVVAIAGLALTHGLLVFLLIQLIVVVILLDFVVVIGAVCGGGIYLLLHRKWSPRLHEQELAEFLPVTEFAAQEGIDEERILARLKTGYYRGGRYRGVWHIHRSELTRDGGSERPALEPVKSKGKPLDIAPGD
ncbi:MAG TPA: hypothetical protein VMH83_07420 [Candidatus Acidoferrum sp.]|nr:hypothetical protein [Candidatus Acidoferrum sp.]